MQKASNWLLRDSRGRIAVWERPNAPLIGWIVATILGYFLKTGHIHHWLGFVSDALLFTWAYLEVTKGHSGIRRLLGAAVMIYTLLSAWR